MTRPGADFKSRPILFVITYFRSFLGIALMVPFTFLASIVVFTFGIMGFRDFCTRLIHGWSRVVLATWGIRVEVRGEENLPAKGGGIIVFNHQSLFDIPVLMRSTLKNIRFGAKIELFRIPFFGIAMRSVGTLPIARENRSEVMKVYREAERRFAQDYIFVLAPEGTRQKDPVIGRFKKGPFMFALSGGVPILPAVIRGAHEVLPKKSLRINVGSWTRTVYLDFLTPVPTTKTDMSSGAIGASQDTERFVQDVRSAMVAAYEKPLPPH